VAGPSVRAVPEGDNRERLVCADCGFVLYDNPKVVVGSVARSGGRVLLFAQTARGEASIDPAAVCVDEKTLLGSYSASVDLQEESVRFVMSREMNLESLISHRFSLSQSVEALHLAAHPQPDSMKIVIQPGSGSGGS